MEGKIAALLFLSFMSLEDFKEKSVIYKRVCLSRRTENPGG